MSHLCGGAGFTSRKGWRYIAVSLMSVAVAHAVLIVGYGLAGLSARMANLVAFAAGALPAYTLNRRWTWERTGRSRLLAEVAPYWALSATSLAISTWAVGAAEHVARQVSESRAVHALAVLAAAGATTAVLWMIKFVVFDRLLFGRVSGDTMAEVDDRGASAPVRRRAARVDDSVEDRGQGHRWPRPVEDLLSNAAPGATSSANTTRR